MRDFSWKYFAITGDLDAYLLYKEVNQGMDEWEHTDEALDKDEWNNTDII